MVICELKKSLQEFKIFGGKLEVYHAKKKEFNYLSSVYRSL
jgi:hypothetical protein